MAESPNITLARESYRHIHEQTESIAEVWLHEGLKKGVETVLGIATRFEAGADVVERAAGGAVDDSRLATSVGGLLLDGPVGIAPGWDKTGKSIRGLQAMGARHVTPGGITLYSQKGNPMPRLRTFDNRVGDRGTRVSLNAYGFPSQGAAQVVHNIAKQKEDGKVHIPVIAQVTLNKEMYEDANRHLIPGVLAATVRKVLPVADGINFGLTSPNTLGMRDAQVYDFLYEAIMPSQALAAEAGIPTAFKGDGDGGEERLDMYCKLAEAAEFSYLELINTTALLRIKAQYGAGDMPGGLAGADAEYQKLATAAIRYVYEAVGDRVDIMGMGGVNSAERALELIRNGASAIGINTAVRTLGAKAVTSIERGILMELDNRPAGTTLKDLIGIDTNRGRKIAA